MKPGKLKLVFVICFCWLFCGCTRPGKIQNVLICAHITNQHRSILRNSCIVSEHKAKDVHGQGPSNINLSLFQCLLLRCLMGFLTISLMWRGNSPNTCDILQVKPVSKVRYNA